MSLSRSRTLLPVTESLHRRYPWGLLQLGHPIVQPLHGFCQRHDAQRERLLVDRRNHILHRRKAGDAQDAFFFDCDLRPDEWHLLHDRAPHMRGNCEPMLHREGELRCAACSLLELISQLLLESFPFSERQAPVRQLLTKAFGDFLLRSAGKAGSRSPHRISHARFHACRARAGDRRRRELPDRGFR